MAKRKSTTVGIGLMEDRDWKAEGDLETLIQARKIQKDSKRMEAAQHCARERMEAAAEISAAGK